MIALAFDLVWWAVCRVKGHQPVSVPEWDWPERQICRRCLRPL